LMFIETVEVVVNDDYASYFNKNNNNNTNTYKCFLFSSRNNC